MSEYNIFTFDEEGEYGHIQREIEKTPDYMLVREFTQNGIEAPGDGERLIEWGSEGNKLTVWNNGDGIPLNILKKLHMMALVGEKTQGKHGNKGIGARITGMHLSPAGVIYDTCDGKTVHRVKLMMINGQYAALDPVDVSNEYDGIENGGQWTNVTFDGSSKGQDTTQKFWQGAPQNDMVGKALWDRYFRFPENVKIAINESLPSQNNGGTTDFKTSETMFTRHAVNHDIVSAGDGITIHYFHLPNWSMNTDVQGRKHVPFAGQQRIMSGIIFQDELFSLERGGNQLAAFSEFGMESVSESVAIFVEVNEILPLSSTAYREAVKWDEIDHARNVRRAQQNVNIRHFSNEIREYAPDWLSELLKENRDKEAEKRRQKYLNRAIQKLKDYGIFNEGMKKDDDGDVNAEPNPNLLLLDKEGRKSKDTKKAHKKPGLRRGLGLKATLKNMIQGGLEIKLITDEAYIETMNLNVFPVQFWGGGSLSGAKGLNVNGRHRFISEKKEEITSVYGDEAGNDFCNEMKAIFNGEVMVSFAIVMNAALEGKWDSFHDFEDESPVNDIVSRTSATFLMNALLISVDEAAKITRKSYKHKAA